MQLEVGVLGGLAVVVDGRPVHTWPSRRAAQLVALLALAPSGRLATDVLWLHSYVAEDKIFCVYVAPDTDRVREHASRGGFPANAIRPVSAVIDPATGGL